MYFKINLQILIVIFLILLILLILFKNNLRSVFTKYNINRKYFSDMQYSSGNLYSNSISNIGNLTITYKLNNLNNHWGNTSAVGTGVGGTLPARWYKWPILYIFDPSGQPVAGNTMQSAYQPGGTLYNVFNKNIASQSQNLKIAVFSNVSSSTSNVEIATITQFSYTNYPKNLINTIGYYYSNTVFNSTTLLANFITGWTATTAGPPTTQLTPDTSGTLSATDDIDMSVTFSGSTACFWSPMVSGRTYIIGISNASTAMRASNDPVTSFPITGRCTNFLYKSFIPSLDGIPPITFNNNPIPKPFI